MADNVGGWRPRPVVVTAGFLQMIASLGYCGQIVSGRARDELPNFRKVSQHSVMILQTQKSNGCNQARMPLQHARSMPLNCTPLRDVDLQRQWHSAVRRLSFAALVVGLV